MGHGHHVSHLGEGGHSSCVISTGQLGCVYWNEQRALVFNSPRHLEVCWIQLWDNEYGYFLCVLKLYESTDDRI